MAINAKVVLFFNQGRWGWTEVYYYKTPQNDLESLQDDVNVLIGRRTAMCSKDVTVEAARISDLDNKGSSILVFQNNSDNPGTTLAAQEPWESYLVSLASGPSGNNLYKRPLLLRGVPAVWNNWTSNPGQAGQIPTAFRSALVAYMSILTGTTFTGGQWCVRASVKPGVGNPTFKVIAVTTFPPLNQFVVGTDAGTVEWSIGDRVHVSGAKGIGTKGLNSDAYVTAVTGQQVTLSSTQKCFAPTVMQTGKPVMYHRLYQLFPIAGYQLERWVKRDTGRPFFGTRGRRATQAC